MDADPEPVEYKLGWKTGPEVVVNGLPLENVLSAMENKLRTASTSKSLQKPEWLDSLEAKISRDGKYEEQISSLVAKVEFMEGQVDNASSKIDTLTAELAVKSAEQQRYYFF
jgi:predicted RNase H-like nuclease (RuvC/YqgF family)